MTYRFLQAVHYSRGYKARRAIVIHMAEGGGTVSWLRNPDNPNVSAHYVVEYDGEVVQMVSEKDSAWGVNPKLLRTSDDSPFSFLGERIRYGVTAAKAALGSYWYDPNASTITIEVEGYAKDGPNAKQRAALALLIADIRSRWGKLPAVAHRDFQSYKACPGKIIPWVDYGGHGAAVTETKTLRTYTILPGATVGKLVVEDEGTWYLRLGDETLQGPLSPGWAKDLAFGPVRLTVGINNNTDERSIGYIVGYEAAFLLAVNVKFTPLADLTPYDEADLADAAANAVADANQTIATQSSIIAALKSDLAAVKATLATVQAALDALKAEMAELATAGVAFRRLLGL